MSRAVFLLGGAQTDFARNFSREGHGLFEMMRVAVEDGLEATRLEAAEIDAAHVGNFTGELFAHQGHLGGLFASLHPSFDGLPCMRHEAACASGSAAALAAMMAIQAGHYDLICVLGVEQMRNTSGQEAAENLAVAAWTGREATEARFLWPAMFGTMMEEYESRYGLRYEHLLEISAKNFKNAKNNPNAQTRAWTFDSESFSASDEHNPVVEGRVRRQDCSQITDGAAVVFLASERFARAHSERVGINADECPKLLGWDHCTATMLFEDKLAKSRGRDGYMFEHVARCADEARKRAGVQVHEISSFEVHDCFAITEYMLTEHVGLAAPGCAGDLIESGATKLGGEHPVNPSGGLIGGGHPVGATGVRMLLDAHRQVRGLAGDYQVEGATAVQTMNIGGSATTAISFVVG